MLDERDDIEIFDASEEETEREAQRHQMRKERAQKMQEEKQRSIKRQRYILLGLALVILFFLLIVFGAGLYQIRKPNTGMLNPLIYKMMNRGIIENGIETDKMLMIGDASGKEGQFSDSDKKTAENYCIDYMDVEEFVNTNWED